MKNGDAPMPQTVVAIKSVRLFDSSSRSRGGRWEGARRQTDPAGSARRRLSNRVVDPGLVSDQLGRHIAEEAHERRIEK
jgi:hypothetical protein